MLFSKVIILNILLCLCMRSCYPAETDTLKQGQQLLDYQHLKSAGGVFNLGFLTLSPSTLPSSSNNHYLGIWYENQPFNPVWMANRDTPIPDSSGALMVDSDGRLKIKHLGGTAIVSNQEAKGSKNKVSATLLDSGNLVLRESYGNGSFGQVLWQSFDYPTNVLLPGMKLGMNLKTGHQWSLTTWLSDTIPSPGAFELGLDPNGTNQLVILRRGKIYWTSGPWKNGTFERASEVTQSSSVFEFRFESNGNEKYFSYSVKGNDTFARWELDLSGQIMKFFVLKNVWNWRYAALCDLGIKNPAAVCLNEDPAPCRKSTQFFVQTRGYFTHTDYSYEFYQNLTLLALSDCHSICWKNCSCAAYVSSGTDGIGCLLYLNASNFTTDVNGQEIYLLTEEKSES